MVREATAAAQKWQRIWMSGEVLTWAAFATVAIIFTAVATALAIFTVMRRKSLRELREELLKAEAELKAATKRSDVNAAARKVMRAKEALKAAEEEAEKH
jgi:predicted Holliday junction resolvase-like endonuclease